MEVITIGQMLSPTVLRVSIDVLKIFSKAFTRNKCSSACGLEKIVLTSSASFWFPDLCFEHMSSHKLAGNGELFSFDPNGHVFWSRHAKLEVECNMGFGRLPYDVQNCLFLAGMYSQTAAQVQVRWKDVSSPLGNHLTRDDILVAGQWAIGSVKGESVIDSYASGNYSYAKACVRFERQLKAYLMQILLACLYVLMSYLGTWINPAATPGRIMLSVTCILIVANNFQAVRAARRCVSPSRCTTSAGSTRPRPPSLRRSRCT